MPTYYLYRKSEQSLHILDGLKCSCGPDVRVLFGGNVLIVHNSLESDDDPTEEEIQDYTKGLLSIYN